MCVPLKVHSREHVSVVMSRDSVPFKIYYSQTAKPLAMCWASSAEERGREGWREGVTASRAFSLPPYLLSLSLPLSLTLTHSLTHSLSLSLSLSLARALARSRLLSSCMLPVRAILEFENCSLILWQQRIGGPAQLVFDMFGGL
jgi:hypothetical protein